MTDVLFETGDCCVFCGSDADEQNRRSMGRHAGKYKACGLCVVSIGGDALGARWANLDAEYDRRKSARPQPEMYGAMPDPLPETLPAGTRWHYSVHVFELLAESRPRTEKGWLPERYIRISQKPDGTVLKFSYGTVPIIPERVNWTTVPRPPSPQVAEAKFKVGDWVEWELGGRNVGVLIVGVSASQWKVRRVPRDTRDSADIRDVWDRELRPWQPQVGELCEGTRSNGPEFRGAFLGYDDAGDPVLDVGGTRQWHIKGGNMFRIGAWGVDRSSLRPCAPPAEPRNGESGKTPRRCVRCTVEEYGEGCVIDDATGLCGHCICDDINAKKTDPYAEHNANIDELSVYYNTPSNNRQDRAMVLSAMSGPHAHPLDRLAAHRAQRRADFDRPLRSAYPCGNQAPCIMVRTERRVEWIPSGPDPWEAE